MGRGGVGNIRASSRSRSRGGSSVRLLSPVRSTGRGGAGNISHTHGMEDVNELQDEAERREHLHAEGMQVSSYLLQARLLTKIHLSPVIQLDVVALPI